MYKLRQNNEGLLEKLKYKRYKDGYSKKVYGKNYDFLDIRYEDKVVNRCKFDNTLKTFIYEPALSSDIADLIQFELVKSVEE